MIRSRFRYYTATNTSYELVITLEADRKETGQSRCTVRIHRSYTATNTLFITLEAVGVALVAGGGFSAQIQGITGLTTVKSYTIITTTYVNMM